MPFRTSGWSCTPPRWASPCCGGARWAARTPRTRRRRSWTSWPAPPAVIPLDLRRALLQGHPRHLGVLELAARQAGWGQPLPPGRARGVAVHECFGSVVAQVAEVSRDGDGLPRVERVVCAVDCGIAVNPDVVRAQMEGSIGFGLGAALWGEITLAGGRVAAVELPRLPRCCASTRCRASRCTSCRRRRRPPAWASPACRPSRPRWPTRCWRSPAARSVACRFPGRRRRREAVVTARGRGGTRRSPPASPSRAGRGGAPRAGARAGRRRAAWPRGLRLHRSTGAERSIALFVEAGKVFQHPRCLNCHPPETIALGRAMRECPTSRRCGAAPTASACPAFAARPAIRTRTTTWSACRGSPAGVSRRPRWACEGSRSRDLRPAQGSRQERRAAASTISSPT